MSKGRIILAVVVGAAVFVYAYGRYQKSLLSPFIMGTARAGMRFSEIDDEARREMKHGFTCHPLGRDTKLCELRTDAPIGTLKIVVDHAGRAAVVQLLAADDRQHWRTIGSATIAQWSHVHQGDAFESPSEAKVNVERWQTPDGRWSAEMTWHRVLDAPTEMTLVDERRVHRIAESTPLVILTLASAKILHGPALARAQSTADKAFVEASNTIDTGALEDADNFARGVAALPECSPALTPVPTEKYGADTSLSGTLRGVAEETIARAYPGRRLVIGEHAMYLSDAAGQMEEVSLYPNAQTSDGTLYAFAVTFPRRVQEASSHAEDFDTGGQCRASSEVLFARVNPGTFSVDEIQRVNPDAESLISLVGTLEFTDIPGAPPYLVAMYLGTYGTTAWNGQVRWNELIAPDSVRVIRRAPISAGKKLVDGTETGGPLLPEHEDRSDITGLSYEPGDTLRFSTVINPSPAAVRHISLPTRPDALPSGWRLLAQL